MSPPVEPGVDVCIVDTGIDMTHPDLKHIELAGWNDFVQSRAEPLMMKGMGRLWLEFWWPRIYYPELHLMSTCILQRPSQVVEVELIQSSLLQSIGTDNGVDIISLSLGGQQGINLIFLSTDELEEAVNRAINQGIYVVAAAGNDGGDNDDGDVSSPGSVEDVICVGAIDTDGNVAKFITRRQ